MDEITLYLPDWRTMADGTRSIVGPGIAALNEQGQVIDVRPLPDTQERPLVVPETRPDEQSTPVTAQQVSIQNGG